MFHPSSIFLHAASIGRWCLAFALAVCLGISGCAALNVRGEPFVADDTFDWGSRVRPPDNQIDFFGFSNKARQIEQDFGAR
jgi:hypothetical protein